MSQYLLTHTDNQIQIKNIETNKILILKIHVTSLLFIQHFGE